jgi:transposase InsO family protein
MLPGRRRRRGGSSWPTTACRSGRPTSSRCRTLTFRTLYVLLFVAHGRREFVHLNVTANPTAAWVWRQLVQATPWGRAPRDLVRDRDAVYGRDFVGRARRLGVETLLTPVRAPRANAVAERIVGTLRRECLDHLIVLNERHLRAVLAELAAYYNAARPHRALSIRPAGDSPAARSDPRQPRPRGTPPRVRARGVGRRTSAP